MYPKMLAAGLLVGVCLIGAAGGAYMAARNGAATDAAALAEQAPGVETAKPVRDTEAVITPADAEFQAPAAKAEPQRRQPPAPGAPELPRRITPTAAPPVEVRNARSPAALPAEPAPAMIGAPPLPARLADRPVEHETAPPVPVVEPAAEKPATPDPPQVRQFEELVVPSSSVIGIQVDTPVSSERARVEDRVDARVTRDVMADGAVAIPAGSRVVGSVTLVERGGKMHDRARLGVRFHTLVLADGREVELRSEAITREGDSPTAGSARKIGGAAIGGAILGALLGGGKGAALGGAAGAAGGSAVVMAGDRNAATLPAGTIVTLRLSAPVTIEVEKR